MQQRLWQLVASAVAWSLDLLTRAGVLGGSHGGATVATCLDDALEMLCLAEMLTRREVAETFGSDDAIRPRPSQ